MTSDQPARAEYAERRQKEPYIPEDSIAGADPSRTHVRITGSGSS
jgi:hypothetical protein